MGDQVGTAIDLLEKLVGGIITLIDNHENILNTTQSLRSECTSIQELLKSIKTQNKESTPAYPIIEDITKVIEEANYTLNTFVKKHNHYNNRCDKGPTIKKPVYKLKLYYYSWDYTSKFNVYAQQLEVLTNKLNCRTLLTDEMLRPRALLHSHELDSSCMSFWNDICGNKIHDKNASWPLFASRYQQLHKEVWDGELKTRIKSAALVEGDILTIYGFINLTKLCGYPLVHSKLPKVLDCTVSLTKIERLELAAKIFNLSKEFYTEEFKNSDATVRKWFDGLENKGEIQERANYCYKLIRKIRDEEKKEEECNDEERFALEVEKARRIVNPFYLRFMIVFQLGQLSRHDFKNVDFPGKSRIRHVIRCYEPLDYANFYYVIVKDQSKVTDEEIKKAKPKFYGFLKEFLNEN